MEQKRNKYWRRQQMKRVFKQRMILWAAYGHPVQNEDGTWKENAHWFELAKTHWCQVYKTTGTPCSCWMCQGNTYSRLDFKKETKRILKESFE